MLSPDDPMKISRPADLEYWVNRCVNNRKRKTDFHLLYRGVRVTVYPKRAVLVTHGGRQKVLDDPERYKERRWRERLCDDVEDAITDLLDGKGDEPKIRVGDVVRAEMKRRAAGGKHLPVDPEAREAGWVGWLLDDELKALMGAWLHTSGAVHGKYSITKQSVVGIEVTNDEFELTPLAMRPRTVVELLSRLASERRAYENTIAELESAVQNAEGA